MVNNNNNTYYTWNRLQLKLLTVPVSMCIQIYVIMRVMYNKYTRSSYNKNFRFTRYRLIHIFLITQCISYPLKLILEKWQTFWLNLPLSKKLRNLKLYIKQFKSKYPPDIKRRDEINITGTKIGYSHLTHAYFIKKESASVCDTCNETITINT